MSEDKVNVTKPFLPPLEELLPHLEDIWETRILSNAGPKHQALESELRDYLGVNAVSLFNNGTVALCTALQSLNLTGEVITTPFSFVATANAIKWNNLKPVFVDIKRNDLNIDPTEIEKAITPNTSAILAVHCYGNPCDTEQIQVIANKYNLKVIYDAAHAFAVKENGESILNKGDLSVLSLHATKVFNTFEGGAIIFNDALMKKTLGELRNFGFRSEIELNLPGINGKMNELCAAAGLLQLKFLDEVIKKRQKLDSLYRSALNHVAGIEPVSIKSSVESNFSYFPILVEDEYRLTRDGLKDFLARENIFVRRYFYPLISEFTAYKKELDAGNWSLEIAKDASSRILCLPIFPDLEEDVVHKIANLIIEASK